ncbi:DUF3040 domain-containing protein [Nocardioides campestrisoli]|uniref:DUF3040 domain-containing protein n=1 Tax=Nocardioides campestrisoli TaxID=2736757 RepID=UPI0015E6C0CC|nr:DUF3040 domain-containing protein [Nocardioides campestrisoli]
MPLSEEELRLLEQMERALVEEDPKFAHTLRGTAFHRAARRRAVIGGCVFALGVAIMMTGAIAPMPIVGVVGFVVMLASATIVVTSLRSPGKAAAQPAPFTDSPQGFSVIQGGRAGRKPRGRGASRADHSFMERMEQRWRRRRETGGF